MTSVDRSDLVGRGNRDGARLFRDWYRDLAARAEAGRRILSAQPQPAPTAASRDRIAVLGAVILTAAAALGLYLATGAPGMADQPFQRRHDARWRERDDTKAGVPGSPPGEARRAPVARAIVYRHALPASAALPLDAGQARGQGGLRVAHRQQDRHEGRGLNGLAGKAGHRPAR